MNSKYSITIFEKYVANWVFKITGLFIGLILIIGIFAPSVVIYILGNYVFDIGGGVASAIATIALGGWWLLWIRIGATPQAEVINVVMNILLAMLLHSERHRYFSGWDFERPIREQLHGWHG